MRVLITGGYGCIGTWIAQRLLQRRATVLIYDLREDWRRMELVLRPDEIERIRFVAGDVAELDSLAAALRDHRVTHVVHLAGLQVPACGSDPVLGARVNVIGTLCLFEAVRGLAAQVDRIV